MGLLLIRYGEIALKGQNRTYFLRRLRQNVRQCLKANRIDGRVWQEGQRLYLEADQIQPAAEAVRHVFGIVSLSPVQVTDADLDAISEEAVNTARQVGLNRERSFRVRARRSDKTFMSTSPDIERRVGAAVVAATGARVDLTYEPDLEIGVEVQRGRALVFGEIIAAPGGLPLGSQGRVVVLLSGGIDSPVAAWLMMKRGCGVIPLHFGTGPDQGDHIAAIADVLNRYAYGYRLRPIVLSHTELLGPTLARLRELHAERWTCLFCKRAMLTRACEIAEEKGASAVVLGDSLGQVASQTLSNMEVISYGIRKPILRPLIGLDKTEIMALARRIGTYEVSIQDEHACPFLPTRPLTQAKVVRLQALLNEMQEQGAPATTEACLPDERSGRDA